MKAIETITGRVSVLNRDDVDTDQIIPKQFLKRVERTGFGEFLFYDWAKEPDWDLPANPILVAGRNFGCGSSREHAPWALEDYGFQADHRVRASPTSSAPTAPRSACSRSSWTADACDGDRRRRGRPRSTSPAQEVRWPGGSAAFEIDPEIKHRLLNGLDDIALTLEQDERHRRLRARPGAPGPVTRRCESGGRRRGLLGSRRAIHSAAPAARSRLRRVLWRRRRCARRSPTATGPPGP